MPTTSSTALVEHALLIQSDGSTDAIPVDSPAWYAWLTHATSFAFRSNDGTFTAHKELRSHTQSYWKAYRRRAGRLHRIYLGRSEELTFDRLSAAAAELAGNIASAAQPAQKLSHNSPQSVVEHSAASDDPAVSAVEDGAQSLHLLSTKLSIPRSRISLVPRPSLVSRLDLGITNRHKLSLVVAPAGFGKTTIVTEWLRSTGKQGVAWLALDDADNHLSHFFAYLIAALETVRPHVGAAAWALLRAHAANPPTQAILTALLNALAEPTDDIVLTLDDYHTISLPVIHEALAFLIDRMPAHLHLVLITRIDPPLPLARLRGRGQLTELRVPDLRFSHAEAGYLFDHVHHILLPPEAVTMLELRTEGWAAGLELAALSLQQQDSAHIPAFLDDFTGSHAYVFDYLADEVFRRQTDHTRRLLIQTAILGRLCSSLCAAVVDFELPMFPVADSGLGSTLYNPPAQPQHAQDLLETLDQANLFLIPLDNNRHWYRYHHLFHDFLREQLERTLGPVERTALYARASLWFEQQGLAGEAIGYALQAQDWQAALRCMTPLMSSTRFYEHYLDWAHWLAALPDTALSAEPDLCRRLAWILMFTGHVEVADRPLTLAEAVWRSAGNQEKLGELLGIRAIAWGWKGNFPRAIQTAQHALALLPADAADRHGVPAYVLGASNLELGNIGVATDWLIAASVVTQPEPAGAQNPSETFLSLAASALLAWAYQRRGDLQHAATLYSDVIRRMGNETYLQVPSVLIYFGSLCYEWNDLAEAERLLQMGIAVAKRIGRDRYWAGAWGLLARVRWANGDALQATALAEHALVVARALDNPPDIAEADILQGWLWLAQGDLPAAQRWLNARQTAERPMTYTHQTEHLMLARIAIAQAQHASEAVDLGVVVRQLEQLLQLAEADQRMADRISILVLMALAHAIQGNSTQTLEHLMSALVLGQPEGYIRTFVDEGPALRSLLLSLRTHITTPASGQSLLHYINRLLGAFREEPPPLLSEREQTVLRCIAEGRSIQETAAILVISAHTARTHVKNIYIKLDAHNRIQALKRARILQLI